MPEKPSDYKVCKEVRDCLGEQLCGILDREGWSDVMINSDGTCWVDSETPVQVPYDYDENGLNAAALILAEHSKQAFNTSDHQSLVAILPIMNLRAIFINRPASAHVSATFRRPSSRLIMPEELVEWGTITQTQLEYLRKCIADHKNIIISGGTGSGKTTLMNSIMTMINHEERLFIIEDTPELRAEQPNRMNLTINNEYSYSTAIADALRSRPTRIIIGECRKGDQTMQMLKAWNTGHPGGLSTIHANSAEDAIGRLNQLCSEVSVSSQEKMILSCVDVILQMKRLEGAVRKVTELLDVRKGELIG